MAKTKKQQPDVMYTVEELATILKASKFAVRQWIRDGRIAAVDMSSIANSKRPRWRIPASEVSRLLTLSRANRRITQHPNAGNAVPPSAEELAEWRRRYLG